MPVVSVIMPCYNHARFLVESVNGILNQTHKDFELLIVDDCSTDNSWQEISRLAQLDPRIRGIRHERNGGASKSRNDGLAVAAGEFIGFCDADDIWEPKKLEIQISALSSNPDCDVTYSDAFIIGEKGELKEKRFSDLHPTPPKSSRSIFRNLVLRNFVNMQTVLMRRSCLKSGIRFDQSVKWVEDWWFWLQLSRTHRFIYLPEPLAKYRVHSLSTNVVQRRGYCINRFKVYRRILQRYTDLPPALRARVYYEMAVDLCALGKVKKGKAFLMKAATDSVRNLRTWPTLLRVFRRLVLARCAPASLRTV